MVKKTCGKKCGFCLEKQIEKKTETQTKNKFLHILVVGTMKLAISSNYVKLYEALRVR